MDNAYQIQQMSLPIEINAVGAQVNAGEHDLSVTLLCKPPYFFRNILHVPAAHPHFRDQPGDGPLLL